MQAGFLLLEIGFSRQKNVGSRGGEDLRQPRIATIAWWAVGFGISSLTGNELLRHRRVLLPQRPGDRSGRGRAHRGRRRLGVHVVRASLFCAVSLAIVWGTTLERIKFSAYVIFAVVFGGPDLPDRRTRGLRRRPAGGHRRQARDGLRRFVGGPPHRCGRRVRGVAAARRAPGQVRARREATGDPGALDAARRPRRPDPVGRLVRLQRRFHASARRTTSSPRWR